MGRKWGVLGVKMGDFEGEFLKFWGENGRFWG